MEKNSLKTDVVENETVKIANKGENGLDTNQRNFKKREKCKGSKMMNGNKKLFFSIVVVSVIFLIVVVFSTVFALININNQNILSGVKIEGVDVSNLSKDDAKSKLEVIFNEKKHKDILLKYQDYDATINPELLETNYDIDKAINEAISVGKNSNIFVNNYNIIFAMIGKINIDVEMKFNEEITKHTIEDIGANIPGAVVESDYYVEGNKLIITKGKEGLKVDTEALIGKLIDNLDNIDTTQEFIEIPVSNKVPDEIDIEKIHSEVYKEVKDAYYTKDPFTIHPEVEGIDFNLEEAKKLLEEDKEQYEIALIITKPKVTTSQIGSEAFPDLIATYSTNYDASDVSRTTNLRLACQKINGKVVLPGEIFSYNKALGERTYSAGYRQAKIYENGQVVDGLGGGICQISSTLYNSVLLSNMEATERRNHQFLTSYTPAGRDATVVYGLTDFKFKNTRSYAIKIKAGVSNGVATVSIYGLKEDNEYAVSFSTKTISTIPYTVKYVEDGSLPVGTEKVTQKGANGVITETYIVKSLNGKVVSTKLLSKDTYNAMQRIILRGTKGAETNTDTNSNGDINVDDGQSNSSQPENLIENSAGGNTGVADNNIVVDNNVI